MVSIRHDHRMTEPSVDALRAIANPSKYRDTSVPTAVPDADDSDASAASRRSARSARSARSSRSRGSSRSSHRSRASSRGSRRSLRSAYSVARSVRSDCSADDNARSERITLSRLRFKVRRKMKNKYISSSFPVETASRGELEQVLEEVEVEEDFEDRVSSIQSTIIMATLMAEGAASRWGKAIGINLDDWSNATMTNLDDYDKTVEEIAEKWSGGKKMDPHIRLVLALGKSATLHSMSRTFFQSAGNDIVNRAMAANPELSAAVSSAMQHEALRNAAAQQQQQQPPPPMGVRSNRDGAAAEAAPMPPPTLTATATEDIDVNSVQQMMRNVTLKTEGKPRRRRDAAGSAAGRSLTIDME